MLCQVCRHAEATIHASTCSPGEPPAESDYCHACYQIKLANWPKDGPPPFPLSRFTIQGLMIVAGLFAILNAAIVLFMRIALVRGTPARIRDWPLKVLLIENLCFAAFLCDWLVRSWLEKWVRYKKTGGAAPMALGKSNRHPLDPIDVWSNMSPRGRLFLALSQTWFLVCVLVFLVPSSNPASWIMRLDLASLLALLLLMISVGATLLWGLVAATRRR